MNGIELHYGKRETWCFWSWSLASAASILTVLFCNVALESPLTPWKCNTELPFNKGKPQLIC